MSIARARKMVTDHAGPVTRTKADVATIRDQWAMNMNKSVASGIGLGIDGQTQAYIKVDGKKAKDLFSSKYVPMTDGTDVLKGVMKRTMSQFGYGNVVCKTTPDVPKKERIGFNNTLVDTSKGGIDVSCAYTKTHPNHVVYTDFPKGPGGTASNPMWEDGTYEEMLGQVTKQHTGLPENVSFIPPADRRRDIFNLQSMTGAEVFGEALFRKEITEGLAKEEELSIKGELLSLNPTLTEAELEVKVKQLRIDRKAVEIARRLHLDIKSKTVQDMAREAIELIYDRARLVEAGDVAEAFVEGAEEAEVGEALRQPIRGRNATRRAERAVPNLAELFAGLGGGAVAPVPVRGHQRSGAPRAGGGGEVRADIRPFVLRGGLNVAEQLLGGGRPGFSPIRNRGGGAGGGKADE